ncbi:MAG: alpha-amylase/4-alpha-glucanotransferase domain-containing protein [Deinococcales bacterium]
MNTPRIALVLYAHQPVGNLEEGVQKTLREAYLPALAALEAHPKLKSNLYLSGALLEWLGRLEPIALSRLAALRNRVEFIAGAAYHPLLGITPAADVLGQVKSHQQQLEKFFNATARGMWLPEFAWEPHLPQLLARTGLDYTVLPEVLFGERQGLLFVCEDAGKPFRVFRASSATLENTPLLTHDTVLLLRLEDIAGNLKGFLRLLEQLAHFETMRLSTMLDAARRAELIYLPAAKPTHGASWREVLHQYPGIGHLQQRSRYASEKLNAIFRVPEEAYLHLWRAQDSAVLHPSGAVRNYLRFEAYRHLIRAENILEPRKYGWLALSYRDLDFDGVMDAIAEAHTMNVYLSSSRGGGILEFDAREIAANLCDPFSSPLSLTDHFLEPEATTLERFATGEYLELGDFVDGLYEIGKYRDRLTLSRLGTVRGPSGVPVTVEIKKAVRFKPKDNLLEVEYQIANKGDWDIVARFGSLWNFALLAPQSKDRQFIVDGIPVSSLGATLEHRVRQTAGWRDDWLGASLTFDFGREITLWTHPVLVDGQYQSSVMLPLWDIDIPKRRSRRLEYKVQLKTLESHA